MTTAIDLGGLPAPNVIEALDYESILDAYKTLARNQLASVLPDWDPNRESDPIVMVLQALAYHELGMRARVNDGARTYLLAFAAGADLDHLAARHGVARLAGETDEAFRERTRLRIAAWANAGGDVHYQYWAKSASVAVKDVAVSNPVPGRVRIAVLAHDGDGTPDAATLAAVRATVTRRDVRVLSDTVEVVPATIIPVAVRARVWLHPTTPTEVFDRLAPDLMAAIARARALGWDLAHSWLVAQLHVAGVAKVSVIEPAGDIEAAADACITLTSVAIETGGGGR